MQTRLSLGLVAVAIVGAMAAPRAHAQTVTGTIQGTVTDATAAVLPGVVIVIRNVETGAVREATTNEVGFYSAPFLAVGTYSRVGPPQRVCHGRTREHRAGLESDAGRGLSV